MPDVVACRVIDSLSYQIAEIIGRHAPLVNSLMFGMPAFGSLPSILLKSVLLAIAAYAGGGTFLSGNFYDAVQDFRIGVPGMLLQIFGGYLFVKYLIRK